VIAVDTIIGDGPAALSCALFAARRAPVQLCARRTPLPVPTVESVPAATLTVLLELAITPDELDVHRLTRERLLAWEDGEARGHRGPVCAHIDTAALRAALWRQIEADPAIAVIDRLLPADARSGWIDASGRRAITAPGHRRPPRTWTAATITVQSRPEAAADLQLAAAPDGYAYRLGSAHWTTIGWVGPNRAPRDAADLRDRIEHAGAGWLLDDGVLASRVANTVRRPASTSLPALGGPAVPIGDAALTRDALASQGVSIGLSDACLVTDPRMTVSRMAARRADAVVRHLRHLSTMIAACRYAHSPAWARYGAWITGLAESHGTNC
jgi:hypothetical protein